MFAIESIEKQAIQRHYDFSTLFYRLLWGEHIHHGLWDGQETPAAAQRNLTDTLAAMAAVCPEQHVLDVGCGMGGSSIHLARRFGCRVTGVTLSPVQRLWAKAAAAWQRLRDRTDFRCQDIENASFERATFNLVWSIECTEHLFDKAGFFRRAAQWLRPGGRMAICAWLAKDGPTSAGDEALLGDVCRGMLCPSLGSSSDYVRWMEGSGLRVLRSEDWTNRVDQTWRICRQRTEWFGLRRFAGWLDRDLTDFLDRFVTMEDAYSTGAMRYGCLIAEKPV